MEYINKQKIWHFRLLSIIVVMLIPLFFIFQGHQTAYAETLSYNVKAPMAQGKVTAWALNVRVSGDPSSQIIDVVHRGDILKIIKTEDQWDEIALSNNQTGWVNNKYISMTSKKGDSSTKTKDRLPNTLVKDFHALGRAVPTQAFFNISLVNDNKPLEGKTIVLDPGHGGKDNGATNHLTHTHEKTLTLATAQTIEQKLENAGAHVIMTRDIDSFIPLQERADISNQNQADAFISIHYNWSEDASAHGITDFYYQKDKDDTLATNILNEVSQKTGMQDRGTRFDNLHVLRNNDQPSTLIELGFLSNPHDEAMALSQTYLEQVAQGIYSGLVKYFSLQDEQ